MKEERKNRKKKRRMKRKKERDTTRSGKAQNGVSDKIQQDSPSNLRQER